MLDLEGLRPPGCHPTQQGGFDLIWDGGPVSGTLPAGQQITAGDSNGNSMPGPSSGCCTTGVRSGGGGGGSSSVPQLTLPPSLLGCFNPRCGGTVM